MLATLPLVLVLIEAPFLQWGLDFISEIVPSSSNQHRWILTATDYFTKWVETIPVKNEIDTVVMRFIKENTLSRFGCPRKIATDNAHAFNSIKMIEFCQKYKSLNHSTPYYLQGNVLEESSNKSMLKVIDKVLEYHKRSWDSCLKYTVWEKKVSPKRSTRNSPFQLVYGTEEIFST